MKKFNHYVFNGAIALLSTAGFVACSSSDDVTDAPVNPSYDGKSVKTQFAISIATPQGNVTRMSAANTQNGNSVAFLGMENIKLIPLTLASGTPNASSPFSQIISLSNIPSNSSAGAGITGSASDPDFHKVYNDVNIATGTNNFLFYGTSPLNTDQKFEVGSITQTFPTIGSAAANSTANNVKFALDVISITDFNTAKTAFASYLNAVANAKYDESNTWSGTTENENRSLYTAYQTFTKVDVLRGGSAAAVLATMQELYNVIKSLAPTSAPTDASTKVEKVAYAIKQAIKGSGNVAVEIDGDGNLSWSSSMSIEYKNFPTKYDLPEGAAQYKYTSSAFAYVEGPEVGSSTTPNDNAIAVKNIAYPLPLTYFANTPLKALDSEFDAWKTSTTDWEKDDSWTSWGDEVKSTTRTVALRNNINYGVACLNTKVICASNQLVDNNIVNPTQVAVPAEGFKVTGILVGGQPKEVNWQYVDETATSPVRDMVIFDDNVDIKAAVAGDFSSATSNYTLVFDNYCTTDDYQKKVNVAIELVNGSNQEFVGVNGNKVAKGQTFYLVGQLDANSPSTSANWPTGLPTSYTDRYPIKGGTAGNAIDRVFVQDFTTTAQFKITSLKNAYVTIPDLRAANLQLGLSVDLTWQSGLTFNVVL